MTKINQQLAFNVQLEKLKRHYQTIPESLSLIVLLIVLISYLHWDWVDHKKLFLWAGLMSVAVLNGAIVYFAFSKRNFSTQNIVLWHFLATQSATITAAIFGSMVFLILPEKLEQQIIIVLTIAGIASSAVTSLSYHKLTIYLYVPIILMPTVYYYWLVESNNNFIAVLLGTYMGFVLVNAYRVNKDHSNSIRLQLQAEIDKKTIQLKQEIYQQLFENAPVSIIHYDQNGVCLSINPAFSNLTLSPTNQYIGKQSFDTIRDDKVKTALKDSLSKGSGYFEGDYWMRKEEVYKHLVIQFAGIRDINGNIDGGIAIVQDLSERRKNELELIEAKENAIKAKNIKSEFLSRMSHDLRTPMNAILGFTELLSIDDNVTPAQKEHLQEIYSAGNILLTQINEILELAKLDKQSIELKLEKINAQKLCISCIHLMSPLADNANLALVSSLDDESHYVFVDKQKLRQCILNLLSNAIKYSGNKGHDIYLNCYKVDGFIRIEVVDKGIGIAEKDMSQVFQPFTRFSDDKTVEGTGIGLSITENLIHKMAGQIGCESTFNEGSLFWIELPAVD